MTSNHGLYEEQQKRAKEDRQREGDLVGFLMARNFGHVIPKRPFNDASGCSNPYTRYLRERVLQLDYIHPNSLRDQGAFHIFTIFST